MKKGYRKPVLIEYENLKSITAGSTSGVTPTPTPSPTPTPPVPPPPA